MQTNKVFLSLNTNNVNTQNNKQIKIGNYILGKTIGKGNSAVVKIATHSIIKQKVAIKMFDKSVLDSDKQYRLMREIESMKRLKHPNIIRIYEIMETAKIICIVTEIASNGELYDYIIRKKRLSEREARHIFKQIVAGIHYCHKNHVIHRDIKVENILLDNNGRVKLADFGFSTFFQKGELMDTWCGSPQYCAPELYLAKLYEGPNVDIWSLGVVLYVLVCGYLPFEAQIFNVLKSQIINGSYKTPFFLSEDCKDLINGMLTLDPAKRIKMDDIINHRWLQADNDLSFLNIVETDTSDMGVSYNKVTKEFRNLVDKIEQISINEFKPNEAVLNEISKYGLNIHEILNSVRNKRFDSNAAIYYLLEFKLANCLNNSVQNRRMNSSIYQPSSSLQKNHSSDNYFETNNCVNTSEEKNQSINYSDSNEEDYANVSNDSFINIGNKESKLKFLENTNPDLNLNNQFSNNSLTRKMNENEYQKQSEKSEIEEEDEDDGMLIEQLGREYLSRNNASVRRHTIGNNADNECGSYIGKPIECLLMLNENEEFNKVEQSLNPLNKPEIIEEISTTKNIIPNHIDTEYSKKSILKKKFNQKIISSNLNQPYKLLKPKQNCFVLGSQQHRFNDYEHNLLQPSIANRRASDGGSNIVLFNQIYATKTCDESSNSNSKNLEINENLNNLQSGNPKHLSRGSITSGIPIFPSLSPSTVSTDSQNLNSSEDEEVCTNNYMKYQRKNSRSRHEPYLDTTNNSINSIVTTNPSRARKSISGSNSPPMLSNQSDPLELIYANRAHLERIYNQSINNLTPAKELLILQQENPSIDEQTQIKWQNQHRKSILSQFNIKETTEPEDYLQPEKTAFQTSSPSPTSSISAQTSYSSSKLKPTQPGFVDTENFETEQTSTNLMETNDANTLTIPKIIYQNPQILDMIREEQNEMHMFSLYSPANKTSNDSKIPFNGSYLNLERPLSKDEIDILSMLQNKEYYQNNVEIVNQYFTILNGLNKTNFSPNNSPTINHSDSTNNN